MIGMVLRQTQSNFFDTVKVQRSMDRATLRALSKFGAFVRRRARSSIRKKKAVSKPGNPPSSHTGQLRDNIFFVLEPSSKNVVIGPILLNQLAFNALGEVSRGTVPSILEKGGAQTIFEEWTGKDWRRIDARFLGNKANIIALQGSETSIFQANARRARPTRKRVAKMDARPFMQPAFDEELPRAPYLWENGIRAA